MTACNVFLMEFLCSSLLTCTVFELTGADNQFSGFVLGIAEFTVLKLVAFHLELKKNVLTMHINISFSVEALLGNIYLAINSS